MLNNSQHFAHTHQFSLVLVAVASKVVSYRFNLSSATVTYCLVVIISLLSPSQCSVITSKLSFVPPLKQQPNQQINADLAKLGGLLNR